jgi:hypothetical protein
MNKIAVLLFVIFSFIACSEELPDNNRIPLAKVFDKYLYLDDFAGIIPPGTSPEDSVVIIRNNIDLWVKKQLILNKAEINLKTDEKEIEKKIEDYRASLLIYEYKQEFLKQKLDTVVENKDIVLYYNSNPESFQLSTPAIRATVITVAKKIDDGQTLNRLFFSAKYDSTKIIDFCKRTNSKYNNFNYEWLLFSNLSTFIPIDIDNPEILLKSDTKFQYQDPENYYYLKINKYRLRGELQPLQFVSDQIKSIILNKRKVALIEELEQNIYQNALEYKNFEILSLQKL